MKLSEYLHNYIKVDSIRIIAPKQLKALLKLEKECKKISPETYFEVYVPLAYGVAPLEVTIYLPQANNVTILGNSIFTEDWTSPYFKIELFHTSIRGIIKNYDYPLNKVQEQIMGLIMEFIENQIKIAEV